MSTTTLGNKNGTATTATLPRAAVTLRHSTGHIYWTTYKVPLLNFQIYTGTYYKGPTGARAVLPSTTDGSRRALPTSTSGTIYRRPCSGRHDTTHHRDYYYTAPLRRGKTTTSGTPTITTSTTLRRLLREREREHMNYYEQNDGAGTGTSHPVPCSTRSTLKLFSSQNSTKTLCRLPTLSLEKTKGNSNNIHQPTILTDNK